MFLALSNAVNDACEFYCARGVSDERHTVADVTEGKEFIMALYEARTEA